MITLNIDLDFRVADFEIGDYAGEFDDEGTIVLEVPCDCGGVGQIALRVSELQTLLQRAEKFQYDRQFRGCYLEFLDHDA